MKKEILSVTGMTCASCAKAVERYVGRVEGVSAANVNFASEKLNVEFDESRADIAGVIEAVKKAGYDVLREEEKKTREVFIPISGMTCAACANAVERAVKKLGVAEASVNFASEKAKVVYDPSKTRISEITND